MEIWRVTRSGNGGYYSTAHNSYEEALQFYNRVKGTVTHTQLQAPNGIIKECNKIYKNGKYILVEN